MRKKLYGYRWVVHIIGFTVILLIGICLVDYITGKNIYQNFVWEKVQDPDVDIDILIMGNSHAYTSIDAAALSDCIGGEVDILGSGSQNMEETLAALKVVLAYEKPKVIMLDVYSACSNTKNELQNEKRGLLYNNLDGVNNYWLKGRGVWNTFKWNNILDGTFQIFRPTSTWDRWDFKREDGVDTHGYKNRKSYAYGKQSIDSFIQEVEQVYLHGLTDDLTEYNIESLQNFLEITEKNDIPVILFSIPTLEPDISQRVNKVFELAADYSNIIYMEDMALQMETIGLEIEDFYDTSHLNQRGSEKFTRYICGILADKFELQADWDRVFAYKSESCEDMGDGTYCYTVENYCPDCLYQFRLIIDGEIVKKQEYSRDNTFITDYDVRLSDKSIRLLCYMIPLSEEDMEDASPSRINMEFMKQNECRVE